MILICTLPPNAIHANMKARKLGVARSVRPFWTMIMWPDPAGRRNRTARSGLTDVRCVNIRTCHDGMPTTENSSMWPQCCMVGIRLTISRQCDMVISPVVRHFGRSAFRHGAGQTDKPSDFYI